MMYNDYVKKIKSVANVKNFIVRFKLVISIVLISIIGLSATYILGKGSVIGSIDIPNEIIYGETLDFSANTMFSGVEFEFAEIGSDNWTKEIPNRAGKYQIRAVSEGSFGEKYSNPVDFTIKPKKITISVTTTNLMYGSVPEISCDGLVYEDSIQKATLGFVYKDLSLANTEVSVIKDTVLILDKEGKDVTSSYEIENLYSAIEFTKFDATISVINDFVPKKEYDGTPFVINNSDFVVNNLPKDESFEVTEFEIFDSNNQHIEKAVTPGDYTFKVKSYNFNNNGVNTTGNYSTNEEIFIGNFEITKRKISYTTGSASKIYDDLELSCTDIFISEGSKELVEGHSIVADSSIQKSIKYFGVVDNEIHAKIIDSDNNDVTDYYDIENVTYGKLSIEQKEIVVNTKSDTHQYNGQSFSCPEFESEALENKNDLLKIADTGIISSITNVGLIDNQFIVEAYREEFTSEENELLNNSYKFIYNYGTLEVTKKPITIGLNPNGMDGITQDEGGLYYIYDGLTHEYNGNNFIISELEELYNAEENISVVVSYNDSTELPLNANEYIVKITGFKMSDLAKQNYDISTAENGLLDFNIRKRDITIEINSNNTIYNGLSQEELFGYTDYLIYSDLDGFNGVNKFLQEGETYSITEYLFEYKQNGLGKDVTPSYKDPIDAGKYTVSIDKATYSELFDNNYNLIQVVESDFEIKKLDIEIVLKNKGNKTYNGLSYENLFQPKDYLVYSSLTSLNGVNTFLQDGETYLINKFLFEYKQNGLGEDVIPSYKEPINAGKYTVSIGNDDPSELFENNYHVNKVTNSDFEIERLAIDIEITSKSTIYNGLSQEELFESTDYLVYSDLEGFNAVNSFLQKDETYSITKYLFEYYQNGLDEDVAASYKEPKNAGKYTVSKAEDTYSELFENNYSLSGVKNADLVIVRLDITININQKDIQTYKGDTYETIFLSNDYLVYSELDGFNGVNTFLQEDETYSITNYLFKYYQNGLGDDIAASYEDPINAGKYKVRKGTDTYSKLFENNYNLVQVVESDFEITRLDIEIVINSKSTIYNGLSQEELFKSTDYLVYSKLEGFNGVNTFLQEGEKYLITKYLFEYKQNGLGKDVTPNYKDPINAGRYTVSIDNDAPSELFENNYNLIQVVKSDFEIARLGIVISTKKQVITYNGKEFIYPENDYFISYSYNSELIGKNSLIDSSDVIKISSILVNESTNQAINAGKYRITIGSIKYEGFAENNYDVVFNNEATELTINRLDVSISLKDCVDIYSKEEYQYNVADYEIHYKLDEIDYSLDSKLLQDIETITNINVQYQDANGNIVNPIHEGTYSIIYKGITYSGPDNYKFSWDDVVKTLTISPKRIEVNTTIDVDTFVYLDTIDFIVGYEFVEGFNLFDGDKLIKDSYSVYLNKKLLQSLDNLNVGTYSVLANLSLESDFSLSDDYDIVINETSFKIQKKVVYFNVSDITVTYDGTSKTIATVPNKFITSYEDGNECLNNIFSDGSTFTVKVVSNEILQNVGTYTVTVDNAISSNGNYELVNQGNSVINYTIKQYQLKITLGNLIENNGIPYSGEGLTKSSIPKIIHNFSGNINISYDVLFSDVNGNYEENPIKAGRYNYNIRNIVIFDVNNNDITKNFDIQTIENGQIDIIHYEITVSAVKQDTVYNGIAFVYPQSITKNEDGKKSYENVDVSSGEIFFNHSIRLIVKYIDEKGVSYDEPINAGSYTIEVVGYEWVIGNSAFYDVTIENTYPKLTINKVSHTISLGNLEMIDFDGIIHSYSSNYTNYQLLGTDVVNFTVYNVNELFDAGIYKLDCKDLELVSGSLDNYSEIIINATYKINKAQIIVEITSGEKDYDGVAFDFDLSNITIVDNKGFNVSINSFYIDKDHTLMNSTKYQISIRNSDYSVEGFDNKNFEIKATGGVYKINPLSIDIIFGNDEETYNGSILKYNGEITIIGNILNNHKLIFNPKYMLNSMEASPIHVGEYTVTVFGVNTIKEYDEEGNVIIYPNYSVENINEGIFTINPYTALIKADNYTLIYGDTSLLKYNVSCSLIYPVNNSDEFMANVTYYQNGNLVDNPTEAGFYEMHIDLDSITVNGEYNCQDYIFVESTEYGVLEIKKLDIDITVDSLTRQYGDWSRPEENYNYLDEYKIILYYKYINISTGKEEAPIHVGEYLIVCDYFEIYYKDKKLNEENYQIIIKDGATLTITPKEISLIPDPSDKTYDGEKLNYDLNQSYEYSGYLVNDVIFYNIGIEKDGLTFVGDMIHAGEYIAKINQDSIYISGDGHINDYKFIFNDNTLVINKRPINISFEFNQNEKIYDDMAVELPNVTVSNLLDGDVVDSIFSIIGNGNNYDEIKYVVRDKNNKVVPYYVSIGEISIIESPYNSLESDYEINSVIQRYTVTPIKIIVKTGSMSYYYCGIDLYYTEGFELVGGELIDGHIIRWDQKKPTYLSTVGKKENVVGYKIYDENEVIDNDRTINYEATTEYGTLEILPRPIYIQTNSSVGTYNGQAYAYYDKGFSIIDDESYYDTFKVTIYEYDVSGNISGIVEELTFTKGGLLNENHKIKISNYSRVYTPSQGEIDNVLKFSIKEGSTTLTSCYDIHVSYGKISVNPLPIYIKIGDITNNTKIYDDIEIDITDVISFYTDENYQNRYSLNGDNFDYSSLIITRTNDGINFGSIKNAGDYIVSLDNPTFTYSKKDVSDCYNIMGITGTASFSISQRPITVNTLGISKFWYGNDLKNLSYDCSSSDSKDYGLLNTHSTSIDYDLSIEEEYTLHCMYDSLGNIIPSSCENKFYIVIKDSSGNVVTDNYDITYNYGTLSIYTTINIYDYTDDSNCYCGRSEFVEKEDEFGKYVVGTADNYMVYLYYEGIYYDSEFTNICNPEDMIYCGEYHFKINQDLTRIFVFDQDLQDYVELTEEQKQNAIVGNLSYVYTISQRSLLITPINKEFVYDGEEHQLDPSDYKVITNGLFGDSMPDGHYAEITTDALLMTTRITSKTVNITDVVIYNQNGEDVTSQFYIIKTKNEYKSYLEGCDLSTSEKNEYLSIYTVKIKLVQKELSLKTNGATKVYDGTALSSDDLNFENDYIYLGGLLPGDTIEFVRNNISLINAGSKNNTAKYIITNSNGVNVTNCYKAYYGENNENLGKLVITKRSITIKTVSVQKVFDNKTLAAEDYQKFTLVSGDLADGDYIDELNIVFNIKISDTRFVGTYLNSINKQTFKIYNASGSNVTNNYNITYEFGIVEISQNLT